MADETQTTDIGFLITHIGKSDNHLYQALTQMSRVINNNAGNQGTTTGAGWYEVPVDNMGNAVPDLSKGYTQNVLATSATLISNSANKSQTTFVLRFIQDATGGHDITFGTDYLGVDNLAILTDPNTRTMIHFTVRPDGMIEMNFMSTGLAA